MTRKEAIESICSDGFRAKFLATQQDSSPKDWMFVPYRHVMDTFQQPLDTGDHRWGILAIRRETLEPDMSSGGGFLRSLSGATCVESNESGGYVYQIQSGSSAGTWVWDTP